jgi:hypothetical protein
MNSGGRNVSNEEGEAVGMATRIQAPPSTRAARERGDLWMSIKRNVAGVTHGTRSVMPKHR